ALGAQGDGWGHKRPSRGRESLGSASLPALLKVATHSRKPIGWAGSVAAASLPWDSFPAPGPGTTESSLCRFVFQLDNRDVTEVEAGGVGAYQAAPTR